MDESGRRFERPRARPAAEHDSASAASAARESFIVRIHFIIAMIRWTGLAPWEFQFPKQLT